MRDILFRGMDASHKWHFGDLEYNRKKDIARIHTYDTDGEYDSQYVVNSDTVGQFTGLVDCAGRRVYEGDVIDLHIYDEVYRASVEYDSHYGCFVLYNEGKKYNFNSLTPANIEVVGNKYEDAYLLKSKTS